MNRQALRVCAMSVVAALPLGAQRASNPLLDSARMRLAVVDGTVRVPGLDSAVEVRRDRWGVPHIYAKTQHDLFFTQGYVAAQDRLWEMDMWRRQGQGRLAEVLGPKYLERDRMARLFAYRGDMETEWRSYAPDAKAIVHAFVDGVNAYVAVARTRPPIEYTMLGFMPERWSYDAPLIRVTALSGVSNGTEELLRAKLVSAVGVKETERLMRTDPYHAIDPVAGLDLGWLDPSMIGSADEVFSDLSYTRVQGSNNWVVSARKTTTGKPILANDPHRAITNPAVRYITHLVGPGWNVIGSGEPASPGVSIGHNERIAFGLTIVGMDQQDVYVERIGPCPPPNGSRRCQRTDGRAVPLRVILDTIRVKGAGLRVVPLEFTSHGPIVSQDTARGRAVVIRMVAQEPGTASYLASLSLDRAGSWRQFLAAMARWKMPSENMIYADVDGNIGWIAAGLMPKRRWSGLLPVPGDGRYEWSGFVPASQLPQSFNPPRGYIATANNNILPPAYRTPISYEFSPDTRARRLHEVLRDSAGFTVRDFERLQHDDLSLIARAYAPRLVALAKQGGRRDDAAVQAVASWDFHMSRDAMAPLVWELWSQSFARALYRASFSPVALTLVSGYTDWKVVGSLIDDASRAGGRRRRQLDSLAVGALDSALATITRRLGPDRSRWRWGAVHVAELKHPLSSAFDLPPVERDGDGNTVFATGGANLRQTSGASYREIFDLSNWDASVAINVPGQSAQPGSEHYADLLPLWGRGEYFPLVFSREKVEQETQHVLVLTP